MALFQVAFAVLYSSRAQIPTIDQGLMIGSRRSCVTPHYSTPWLRPSFPTFHLSACRRPDSQYTWYALQTTVDMIAPQTTERPKSARSNGKAGSRLRLLWPRRATPERSSISGLKGPDDTATPVTATSAVLAAGKNDPPNNDDGGAGGTEDGDFDGREDEAKAENKEEGADGPHNEKTAEDEPVSRDDAKALGPVPNLWEIAWNKLGTEAKDFLRPIVRKQASSTKKSSAAGSMHVPQKAPQKAHAMVDSVIKNTQQRMASYRERWGSDDESTTLGQARSILVSALTIKELLDGIFRFDPTWYGSAAWAVVSFSLTVCCPASLTL
ncbi:hypothetical protein F5Y17DRAFT_238025 [Xylariaceae sp. FL0594]|nr:hypothetical protein F5Y17DRAFT_238025 [Xylariaceae sp. FL0594]